MFEAFFDLPNVHNNPFQTALLDPSKEGDLGSALDQQDFYEDNNKQRPW